MCVSWLLRGLTDDFFLPFSRNSIWVVHPFVGFFCLHSVARIFSQLRPGALWNYCLSFLKVRKSKFCVFFENLWNVQNGPTYSSPISEKSESNSIEPLTTLGARKRPRNKKNRMENAYFWILRNEASNLPSQTLSFPFIPHGNELPKFAFELKNFQGLL